MVVLYVFFFIFSDTLNILHCTKEYIAFWKVPRLRLFALLVTIDAATEVGSIVNMGSIFEVCYPRCVCENWKVYVVKHNYVI